MLEAYCGDATTTINQMKMVRDDIRSVDYQAMLSLPIDLCSDEALLCVRPAMFHDLLIRGDYAKRPALIKTHNRMDICPDYIAPRWLSFGAIYLIRDPRDVVISFAKHMGSSIDETINVMTRDSAAVKSKEKGKLTHYLGPWDVHVNSWCTQYQPETLIMRYEDMLADPKRALETIIKFIDIELEEEHVDRAVAQSHIDNLRKQEDKEKFVETGPDQERFFNRGTAGHWKEILTKGQVNRIEKAFGETMKKFNYEL